MLWLAAVGALVAFVLGGLSAAAAFALLVLVLPTLSGLFQVFLAAAIGIRVVSIDVGSGEAVIDHRGERLFLLVRSFPVGLAWFGQTRSRRLVRTRFFIVHLLGVLVLTAVALLAFLVWSAPALGCAAAVALLAEAVPGFDGAGRSGSVRQVLTIPRMQDEEIVDWSSSSLARAADRALYRDDASAALDLAQRALDEDERDRLALTTLAAACDRLGQPVAALAAAERLTQGGDRASLIASQGNLAWYLTRCTEAGQELDGWRGRALDALDIADELGDRWELHHTRALVRALAGLPDQAEQLLAWPESQVLAPESTASLLLTRAHIHRLRGEPEAARTAVEDARRLTPNMARVDDVQRWLLPEDPTT